MGQGVRLHKTFFLVNPVAGSGQARTWWQAFLPRLEELDGNFFWQYSESAAAGRAQVRRAVLEQHATAVIAVGGDGTLHECLNGIMNNDQLILPNLLYGIYPAGSACDLRV